MKNDQNSPRVMPLGVRVALCAAIGASLAVSLDPATGIALAGGLFVVLASAGRCARTP